MLVVRVDSGVSSVNQLLSLLEEFLVEVVEDARKESTQSCTANVHGHVVRHDALWVHAEQPRLEEGAANG